ncbi:MAG: MerR family transcriptional regulator [Thermoanaerobaculia bacterium]
MTAPHKVLAGIVGHAVGHPIAVVAARTGLSRDVLRVWERRYGAVEPMRSPGGQRRYSDEHVHRFQLLAAATRHGRSISAVADLGTEALARMAVEDEAALPDGALVSDSAVIRNIDAAMEAIRALDGAALDATLRRASAREGVPWFVDRLVPALMRTVGDGWVAGRLTIAHEHLASAAVIALLLEPIRTPPAASTPPRLVVATPSTERHAAGAAASAAAASMEGWAVVYLGPDVPCFDISGAAAATDARAVALSIVYVEDRAKVVAEVRALRDQLQPKVPIFLGGAAGSGIAADLRGDGRGRGITLCESTAQFRTKLAHAALSR